jgi:hypothetical protein
MRGNIIKTASFDSLNKEYKLFTHATDIILTGFSGGGAATFAWCNYLHSNAKANVWCVPDSGTFLYTTKYKLNN